MKALILSALLVLVASTAQAFPHITVRSSEILQADPMRVKTTFDVDLVGPGTWCFIDLVARGQWNPATGDTTRILDLAPPSGWTYFVASDGSFGEFFRPGDGPRCFGAGDHFAGFAVVSNNVSPCFHIIFATPLLGLDGSYHIDACMVADGPVSARNSTWGALKSTYR